MQRPHQKMRLGQNGFTLVETLVAIGIVGALLALVPAIVIGSSLARAARFQSYARNIAQTELQSLRSGGYSALPSSGAFSSPALSTLPGGSGQVTVSAYNSTTDEVAVVVSWNDPSEGAQSVELDTLITKTGGLP